MSNESADFVIRRLFSAGLALGSCVHLLDEEHGQRVASVISALDEIGRDVRRRVLVEGGPGGDVGGDPQRQALVAGMSDVLGALTSRLDALGRSGVADDVPSPHLLDAVQSMERALAYLNDGVERGTDGDLVPDGPKCQRAGMAAGPTGVHAHRLIPRESVS